MKSFSYKNLIAPVFVALVVTIVTGRLNIEHVRHHHNDQAKSDGVTQQEDDVVVAPVAVAAMPPAIAPVQAPATILAPAAAVVVPAPVVQGDCKEAFIGSDLQPYEKCGQCMNYDARARVLTISIVTKQCLYQPSKDQCGQAKNPNRLKKIIGMKTRNAENTWNGFYDDAALCVSHAICHLPVTELVDIVLKGIPGATGSVEEGVTLIQHNAKHHMDTKAFIGENLDFLQTLIRLEASGSDEQTYLDEVKQIRDKFIIESSSDEVNLPSDILNAILKSINTPDPDRDAIKKSLGSAYDNILKLLIDNKMGNFSTTTHCGH